MSLIDRLEDTKPQIGPRCSTCQWVSQLEGENKEQYPQLLSMVAKNQISIAHFHSACKLEGLETKLSGFRRHVRDCEGA